MADALQEAVSQMQAARAKASDEGQKKLAEHRAFQKKFDQLDKAKDEKDFAKKKKACEDELKAMIKTGTAQAKATTEWEAKIKAAKKQVEQDLKNFREFKAQWLDTLEKARVHNEIVNQLNPPGPATEKLKQHPSEKITQFVQEREPELLDIQNEINKDDAQIAPYKAQQKNDTEILESLQKKLAAKEFQGKGKKK